MRRLLKKITMFMLAGWLFLGIPGEVRAEKKESPELAELLGCGENCICYDCGSGTEDGALEFKSDSHSLKEGDIVEVQMIYNADKDKVTGGLSYWEFYITHDADVMEYLDMEMKDEYRKKYLPYLDDREEDDRTRQIYGYFTRTEGNNVFLTFEENDVLLTMRYKIKKAVPATRLYVDTVRYGKRGDWNNMVRLYENEAPIIFTDVFTVNIEDNIPDLSLALSSAPARGSGEIIVPINIEKNDGFNLLGLTLNYDTSLFTYESLEIEDKLKSKISLDSVYEEPGSRKIKASFIALEDITDTGEFLKLKLKVKDGISEGTTSNVGVEITQVGNKAETDMSGTGTNCAVKITSSGSGEEEQQPVLGDVNADKNIDLVDAVYILQNYNQVREFTKVQETAADVDKNGTVNLLDAVMIMKYYNGEITGF